MKKVGLRIDVDTYKGMSEGVPALLKSFDKHGVKGSFFLTFGPDNAGKAIWNVFKEKGFLKKMLKTNALKMYGIRTILSGLLLPPRIIAADCPEVVKSIREQGHEVGIHAWDHRRWQDNIDKMSKDEIVQHFEKAIESFHKILGDDEPLSFAAPSWKVSPRSLEVEDRLGLVYASDLRFDRACFLEHNGKRYETLQIPASSRCIEELLSAGISDEPTIINEIIDDLQKSTCPVITVHAEVEGNLYADYLDRLIEQIKDRVGPLVPLCEMAADYLEDADSVPVCQLGKTTVAGRSSQLSSAFMQ